MKNNKQTPDFDFDHWASIAQQDPEQFEQMRQQLIDDLLDQTPDHLKQRMVALQWQIDHIREQADSPMDACLSISQKMMDSILGENGLLDTLNEPDKVLQSIKNNDTNNVISINKYKTTDD